MSVRFFAYRPRGLRRALLGAAVLSVMLSAWALSASHRGAERLGTVRAAVLGALAVAFGVGWVRLRPRADFGVRLDVAGIVISRVWGTRPAYVPWTRVAGTRTEHRAWNRLVIDLRPEGQVFIAEPLLGSREAFADLLRGLQERSSKSPGDA